MSSELISLDFLFIYQLYGFIHSYDFAKLFKKYLAIAEIMNVKYYKDILSQWPSDTSNSHRVKHILEYFCRVK